MLRSVEEAAEIGAPRKRERKFVHPKTAPKGAVAFPASAQSAAQAFTAVPAKPLTLLLHRKPSLQCVRRLLGQAVPR